MDNESDVGTHSPLEDNSSMITGLEYSSSGISPQLGPTTTESEYQNPAPYFVVRPGIQSQAQKPRDHKQLPRIGSACKEQATDMVNLKHSFWNINQTDESKHASDTYEKEKKFDFQSSPRHHNFECSLPPASQYGMIGYTGQPHPYMEITRVIRVIIKLFH